MTRDELKEKITPILCNLELTAKERASQLGPIFIELIPESVRRAPRGTKILETYGDIWNSVMAEIVQEQGLGADGKGIKASQE